MHKFSPEELKRTLSIAEAACLWCDLPFTILEKAVIADGIPWHADHPDLYNAADALCDATDSGEIHTQHDEDGFLVAYQDRRINRDDLIVWLKKHHPDHQPASLFRACKVATLAPVTASPPKERPKQELSIAEEDPEEAISWPKAKLIRLPQARELTGLSKSKIYAMIGTGDFPRQIKRGTLSFWAESEILEWNKRVIHGERGN